MRYVSRKIIIITIALISYIILLRNGIHTQTQSNNHHLEQNAHTSSEDHMYPYEHDKDSHHSQIISVSDFHKHLSKRTTQSLLYEKAQLQLEIQCIQNKINADTKKATEEAQNDEDLKALEKLLPDKDDKFAEQIIYLLQTLIDHQVIFNHCNITEILYSHNPTVGYISTMFQEIPEDITNLENAIGLIMSYVNIEMYIVQFLEYLANTDCNHAQILNYFLMNHAIQITESRAVIDLSKFDIAELRKLVYKTYNLETHTYDEMIYHHDLEQWFALILDTLIIYTHFAASKYIVQHIHSNSQYTIELKFKDDSIIYNQKDQKSNTQICLAHKLTNQSHHNNVQIIVSSDT